MSRVGFIGTGHIAAPMARALARDGHEVIVSERNSDTARGLSEAGLGIRVGLNQQVADESDIVFLCLRPDVWQSVVQDLSWDARHRIISVMAGVTLSDLRETSAPAATVCSTIPYGFIEFGGCPLPVAGDPGAVQQLFGGTNAVIPLSDEADLSAYFAASSLVSGVLGLLGSAAGWLGETTGERAAAEVYTSGLAGGFLWHGDFAQQGRLDAEKRALATPGTLNRQMVEGLEGAGAFDGLPALLSRIRASMETAQ
ncbi:NAD(P)-binding domain-containing protein [uncultured Roseobacter sp.]|uniref:NAD(P)-binding domain-containing protein n=1 Tax=uncultured Roseobacter sp. TaxID=114847 RepID=UPI00262046A6|nr:NAD(P)-binding domain-containing protein [uncultured Roseobacter sp.]